MFSSSLYADWTALSDSEAGTFYTDFEKIRKVDGYVYYWELGDFLKPIRDNYFSSKSYRQGDCRLYRHKYLSVSFHQETMGRGTGDDHSPKNPEWKYPPPESNGEIVLATACEYVKLTKEQKRNYLDQLPIK
jgi:hypothetical protein